MKITEVCHSKGCDGNSFYIKRNEAGTYIKCTKCGAERKTGNVLNEYELGRKCSTCNCEKFKVRRDTITEITEFRCLECGEAPKHLTTVLEIESLIDYDDKSDDIAYTPADVFEGIRDSNYSCLACGSKEWFILGKPTSYMVLQSDDPKWEILWKDCDAIKLECAECGHVQEQNIRYFLYKNFSELKKE